MSDSKKVLRCPFCGSKNGTGEGSMLFVYFENDQTFVRCFKCGAQGPSVRDANREKEAEAIRLWNTRHFTQPVDIGLIKDSL